MSKLVRNLFALVAAASLLFSAPRGALADVSPPPAPHGASIAPPGETAVRLEAQEVLIEAQRNAGAQTPYALVTADYWLVNDGAEDEELRMRFPLSTVDHYENRQVCDLSPYLPLQELRAWVDEIPINTRVQREPADSTLWAGPQPPPERVNDCWAFFTVRAPAGARVHLRLSYRQEAGMQGYPGYALYRHALQPSALWPGPVRSTRVVFRAPWALTEENFPGHAFPIERLVEGLRVERFENEIHWTFGEMEPDAQADIVVSTMNPAVYSAINRGRMLYPGSRDSETWGRYALAAKQATLHPGGFRAGPIGERLYTESFEAYTRALELVPWSAAWQAGFAELLCANAAYPTYDLNWSEADRWQACASRLKAALDLNPQQELALRVLAEYGDERYAALVDGRPVFPALSLTPPPRSTPTGAATATTAPTPEPSNTPEPTVTMTATATATANATASVSAAATTAETEAAAAPLTPTPEPTAPPAAGLPLPGTQVIVLAALLPLAAAAAIIAGRRRRQPPR